MVVSGDLRHGRGGTVHADDRVLLTVRVLGDLVVGDEVVVVGVAGLELSEQVLEGDGQRAIEGNTDREGGLGIVGERVVDVGNRVTVPVRQCRDAGPGPICRHRVGLHRDGAVDLGVSAGSLHDETPLLESPGDQREGQIFGRSGERQARGQGALGKQPARVHGFALTVGHGDVRVRRLGIEQRPAAGTLALRREFVRLDTEVHVDRQERLELERLRVGPGHVRDPVGWQLGSCCRRRTDEQALHRARGQQQYSEDADRPADDLVHAFPLLPIPLQERNYTPGLILFHYEISADEYDKTACASYRERIAQIPGGSQMVQWNACL